MPGQSGLSYDVSNRLATAGGDYYGYDANNKRVYKKENAGAEEFYFFGLNGQRLAAFTQTTVSGNLYLTVTNTHLYFAGKLIRSQGSTVVRDRLGSNRAGGMNYFPYGEEQSPTSNNKEKFGTYFRDQTTGFDYADQRYFRAQLGRFLTPDPYMGSGSPGNPGSWNRYAYSLSDPTNLMDPNGLNSITAVNYILASSGTGTQSVGNSQVFGTNYINATPSIGYTSITVTDTAPPVETEGFRMNMFGGTGVRGDQMHDRIGESEPLPLISGGNNMVDPEEEKRAREDDERQRREQCIKDGVARANEALALFQRNLYASSRSQLIGMTVGGITGAGAAAWEIRRHGTPSGWTAAGFILAAGVVSSGFQVQIMFLEKQIELSLYLFNDHAQAIARANDDCK
jgi:RHS repeat-associated protein